MLGVRARRRLERDDGERRRLGRARPAGRRSRRRPACRASRATPARPLPARTARPPSRRETRRTAPRRSMRQMPGRDQHVGIVAADQERVPDRPAGEPAHLVERDRERVLDRGGLVRRRGRAAEQLQRVGAAADRGQDAVVLGRDLADLGVRLDADRAGEVAAPAVLVHVRRGGRRSRCWRRARRCSGRRARPPRSIRNGKRRLISHRTTKPTPERPDEAHADADELDAESAPGGPTPTGNGVDVAEEPDGQRSPDAGAEVNRHGADRVVDLAAARARA